MDFVIDGYNLLHAVGLVRAGESVGPHQLERARTSLVGLLSARFQTDSSRITVVFDAANAPPINQDKHDYQGIQVLFARDEEADDQIESIIRRCANPKKLTVVSNDRRLQDAARRGGCMVMSCFDFWDLLQARPRRQDEQKSDTRHAPLSTDERDAWLREFADLDEDPALKELNVFGCDDVE